MTSRRPYEIIVTGAPRLSELRVVHMKISDKLLHHYYSYHNAVTVALRALILHDSAILACPGWREDDFCIVMHESQWRTTDWRKNAVEAQLEIVEDGKSVDDELFVNCVWYAVMVRMAPEWNRVDNMFIQGCDFLRDSGRRRHRAIEMKTVYLPPGRLQFVLIPHMVSLSPLSLSDLGHGLNAESETITYPPKLRRTCYVLPRCTKGSIVTSGCRLPAKGVFPDYQALRKYWKNMYGYYLPTQSPDFYCEVVFYGLHRTVFTYPSYCLLSRNPDILKFNVGDPSHCIKAFVTDLYAKVSSLCGMSLQLAVLPRYEKYNDALLTRES